MIYIKKTSIILFVFIVLGLLSPSLTLYVSAEDNGNSPKGDSAAVPTFTDEVVVYGEAVADTATVSHITWKDIKAKGIKNIAQALEAIPGAHVRVGGKGEAYIRLRGFRQREIAVLIDGVPVYSPYDGNMDLSSLPIDAVERIEVVKGPASMLYGSNAMGGVVNIITRASDGSSRVSLMGEYGSGQSSKLGATLQGSAKGIRYLLTGSYDNREYFPLSGGYNANVHQEEGGRANSDHRKWNGKLSLGWDAGKTGKASLNVQHIDIARGLPHHESDKKNKYWRFTDWRKTTVDMVYQNDFANASIKGKLFYGYFTNALDSYDDAGYDTQDSRYGWHSTLRDYSMGGDFFFRYHAGSGLLLKSAVRFHSDIHRQQDDEGDEWERNRVNFLSVPVEAEWSPSKAITVTGGTSVDMMFFKKYGTDESTSTTAFSGQVALLVEAAKGLRLKGSVSRRTRFPTMKELFSSTSGNPDLKPMKTTGFELGFDYRLTGRLEFSAVGFYNNVDDMIDRAKKYDPYINVDEAVFKGIETGIRWHMDGGHFLSLFYTHLMAEDKTTEDNKYIQYRPRHKIDASVMLNLPAGIKCSLNGSYVSSQIYYDDDDNEAEMSPYTLIGLRVSKRFGRLELFASVRNLFDVNYYQSEGFPLEGRMIFAGVRFDIQ